MNNHYVSKIVLLLAMITIVYLFYVGSHIAPEIKSMGMFAYIEQQGFLGGVIIFSFSFAFPFALLCIVLAGFLKQKGNAKLNVSVSVIISLISMLVVIWPFIVGAENSRWYFMFGGGFLFVLISTVAWFWSQQRNQTPIEQKKIVDLRGMAYFSFALATWNSCGAMGMPGYGLYPERSLAVDAYPFIIGQVKVIMLYFILGWLSLALSYMLQRKLAKK